MSALVFFILSWLLKFIFKICIVLFAIWLINQLTMGINFDTKDLTGKIILITGGNAGVGYETAKGLASMGGTVIIASRNVEKSQKAIETIKNETGNSNVYNYELNLSSFKNIQKFVGEFKKNFSQIDILINNAAIAHDMGAFYNMRKARLEFTEEGLELIMGTNYFGMFYLTDLLKDLLFKSASESEIEEPTRIINVSSMANSWADQAMLEKGLDKHADANNYNAELAYGNAKFAMNLFTHEFLRRYKDYNFFSVSLHPGFVKTDILRTSEPNYRNFVNTLTILMGKNSYQGAQTTLYACLNNEDLSIKNGKFLSDCRIDNFFIHKNTYDEKLARTFWDNTVKIIERKLQ